MTEAPRYCQHCGAALAPGMTFCGSCGRPLASAPAPAAPTSKKNPWLLPVIIGGLGCAGCLVVAVLGVLLWNYVPGARQSSLPPTLPPAVLVPTAPTAPDITMPSEPTRAPTPIPATLAPTLEPTSASIPGTAFDYQNIHLTYDPSLATKIIPTSIPASPPDAAPWEVTPAHIELELAGYPIQGAFHKPHIIIYPIDAYVALVPDIQQTVDRLKTVIKDQPAQAGKDGMPFLPVFNAAQVFSTQIRYLDQQGVRYLTQYGQDVSPINNNALFYTYQGLAGGGKYYVIAILPVNHPSLPPDYNLASGDYQKFVDTYPQYLADIRAKLGAEQAGSFTPDLALLDQLVESIEVK